MFASFPFRFLLNFLYFLLFLRLLNSSLFDPLVFIQWYWKVSLTSWTEEDGAGNNDIRLMLQSKISAQTVQKLTKQIENVYFQFFHVSIRLAVVSQVKETWIV